MKPQTNSLKKRILIAEDDVSLAQAIKSILETSNFTVTLSCNGQEAKDLIVLEEFDLVLSDIRMPLCNGIELLHFIKRTKPIPVVLMTGFAEIGEAKEACALGASGFLPKPFSKSDLLGTISSLFKPEAPATQNLDDQFSRIRIDEFISGKEINFDIFIRINEHKYVKIAHGGESIDITRVKSYTKAGLEYLYIRREDLRRYANFSLTVAKLVNQSNKFDQLKKQRVLQETTKSILSNLYNSEIDRHHYEVASDVINNTIEMIAQDDVIVDTLDSLNKHSDRIFSHSMAVSLYAVMVAKAVGWISLKTKITVSLSGLFHDLGLKEIPRDILNKKRMQRSLEETRAYESHPIRGMELLSSIPNFPKEVSDAVLYHHEDSIGMGFPFHYKKNKTTPISRLLYVVNELCQLTHPITDEEAISPTMALTKLICLNEERFDPIFLEGLKKVIKKIQTDQMDTPHGKVS